MSKILYTPKLLTAIKYGALYNWYVVKDIRGICPIGWHIPTIIEATTFNTYIGGANAGGVLKETGFIYWLNPNTGATNQYGFNLRGAGSRSYSNGTFQNLKNSVWIWTSEQWDDNDQYCYLVLSLQSSMDNNLHPLYTTRATYGASLRPVKDSTTLTHGQTGTCIGNDGKIYRTICIGTQEWIADNYAETKFRNGDIVPLVTDNAAWVALPTAGMCYYNNDINNC